MYTEWTESGDIDGDEWGKEAAGWRVDVECDARTGRGEAEAYAVRDRDRGKVTWSRGWDGAGARGRNRQSFVVRQINNVVIVNALEQHAAGLHWRLFFAMRADARARARTLFTRSIVRSLADRFYRIASRDSREKQS